MHDALGIGGIGAGVTVAFAGSRHAELADAVRHAWSRCLQPVDDPAAERLVFSLRTPDEPSDTATDGDVDLGALLPRATQAITRSLISAQVGRLVMLHAGAVADPDTGRTLVYVAPGGTGKTTLTRLLGTRYGYLSDETVAIDAEGRVLPYPKPLSERTPGGPKAERSPDDLGLVPAPDDARLARLVLLDRSDEHARLEVAELGLLDALEGLAAQSSALYELPSGLRLLERHIEATGPVLRVRYADASQLTGLAAELLRDAS